MKGDWEETSSSLLWSSSGSNYKDEGQSADMSIPFERYEEEFREVTQQVKKCLDESDVESTNTSSSLSMAFNLLTQCDDLVKQMSVEARSHSKEKKRRILEAGARVQSAAG